MCDLVGDEQVLRGTTGPLLHVRKPVVPLATAKSTSLKGTFKEILRPSVLPGQTSLRRLAVATREFPGAHHHHIKLAPRTMKSLSTSIPNDFRG